MENQIAELENKIAELTTLADEHSEQILDLQQKLANLAGLQPVDPVLAEASSDSVISPQK